MKTIHPNQQNVIFKDDYPVIGVEISSKSHPAFKDNGIIEAPRGSRAESFAKRYNRAANA